MTAGGAGCRQFGPWRPLQITVNGLAFDSGSPATLYAVTYGGVFKTNDGGANWTSIDAGLAGLTPAASLRSTPLRPARLYLGVFDSDDGDCATGAGVLQKHRRWGKLDQDLHVNILAGILPAG